MGVGIQLGNITDEIGSSTFLYAFFSTIAGNLESDGWGSRFPIIMNKLYAGTLSREDGIGALAEMRIIQSELTYLSPSRVIWSLEDRSLQPPWGDDISTDINSLADYFVTAHGRDLIGILVEIFEDLAEGEEACAKIVSY
ncbi:MULTISPECIES: Imm70 family immunity protein [Stenotrophomonas]|jgi:hypothetical protein|uniref:Imm70 family immunity protein n=1 Tax=Stenotrophomonas TaxID=40323 RepID=UPI00092B92C9|nr:MULTISPECIES: Imm70 family immunity protein [Stenotrophomonas]OJH80944.1 MAG: hypothetical protein BSK19_12070 [Stenotrophomonas maltophilia]PII17123.1 hypothetical protein CR920_15570 [Stenotrophomonas indicatrix]